MIKYVQGDILLTGSHAIAHGVAPNDDFKQGVALSLRERWPSMYKDFRHFSKTTHPKEGTLWSWKGAGGPVIVNLFTQEHSQGSPNHPGPANLKYVNSALKELVNEVKVRAIESIAITKLATGVGGLDWSDVKPLIEENLSHLEIPVFIYDEYRKDQKAQEV